MTISQSKELCHGSSAHTQDQVLLTITMMSSRYVITDITLFVCLGPIAWLMLGACSSHSKAHACLCSPNIEVLPHKHYCTTTVQHEHSNKRLYHTPAITNKSIAYLYMRHGGSTELAPPMAKEGIRPVRDKEKRKAKDLPRVYSYIIAQEGRSSQIGSSCIQLVQVKAQESQGSGRWPWTHTG